MLSNPLSASADATEPLPRVLIIGLDGATFDLIKPWAAEGRLPTFKKLMESGAWGESIVDLPPGTVPNWPSFATGKNPGKHGLIWWVKQDPKSGDSTVISSADLQGQTLWDIAGQHGLQVGVINMPVIYPPYPVNGFMISGLLTPPGATNFTYPADLRVELETNVGEYRVFPKVFFRKGSESAYLADLHQTLDLRANVVRYLMQNKAWNLFTVVFGSTDWAMHAFWKYHDSNHPRHNPQEARELGHALRSIYEHADRVVGELLELAGENTHVFIMSDHGAGPAAAKVMVNNWLLDIGLLKIKRAPLSQLKYWLFRLGFVPENIYPLASAFRLLNPRVKRTLDPRRKGKKSLIRRVFLSFNDVDWARTQAFTLGGMGQIFINLKGRNPFGCVEAGAEYDNLREYIIRRVAEIKLPDGKPFVKRVYRKEELYHGDFMDRMPDLLLFPSDMRYLDSGIEFFTNRLFSRVEVNSGAHRTNGVFMLWGPHVKSGLELNSVGDSELPFRPELPFRVSIRDIAPTALHLLGLPVPEDMDGKVITHALTEEFMASHPVQTAAPQSFVGGGRGGMEFAGGFASEEDEKLIRQRLTALGYLD